MFLDRGILSVIEASEPWGQLSNANATQATVGSDSMCTLSGHIQEVILSPLRHQLQEPIFLEKPSRRAPSACPTGRSLGETQQESPSRCLPRDTGAQKPARQGKGDVRDATTEVQLLVFRH